MMAENIVQEIAPANLDLLMNAASWLRAAGPTPWGSPPRRTSP